MRRCMWSLTVSIISIAKSLLSAMSDMDFLTDSSNAPHNILLRYLQTNIKWHFRHPLCLFLEK